MNMIAARYKRRTRHTAKEIICRLNLRSKKLQKFGEGAQSHEYLCDTWPVAMIHGLLAK